MRRLPRIAVAMACGAISVFVVGWPELRSTTRETWLAWLIILATALVACAVTLTLLSFRLAPRLSILAAVTITAIFFTSPLPIYLYQYRGMPPGSHVSISPPQRYAAPLAILVAVTAYALIGLAHRLTVPKGSDAPVA